MTLEAVAVTEQKHARSRASATLSRPASSILFAVVFSLIIIAGIWLRWSGLSAQSLWADEGYTTWFSQFTPAQQWHVLPWETQGPVYHILLHYWVWMWGTSETAFRAMSALFATLSIGMFFLVARRISRDRFFISIGLMFYSFSFFQIWYAKEARSYALLGFVLLTSIYCTQLCL